MATWIDPTGTYTVIGFWQDGSITVVGIVAGEQEVFGGDQSIRGGLFADTVMIDVDTVADPTRQADVESAVMAALEATWSVH